jgi:predicted metal-dependent hydrolase
MRIMNDLSRKKFPEISMDYRGDSQPDPLQDGINFFNAGRFFEAHEAWEDIWRATRGPLRLFYQGLVQAAVGLHHLRNGNLNGAAAQLRKSLAKLEQYPALCCRIDNRRLKMDLRDILDQMTPKPIHIKRV